MSTATQTAADGTVVSVTTQAPQATISFGSKRGLPNYSNDEMSVFLQVPLDGVDLNDPSAIEKALIEPTAVIKSFVYNQLGVAFEVHNGVVVGAVPEEAPKKERKIATSRGGKNPKPPASNVDKDDLWGQLAGAKVKGDNFESQSGETVWDNRTSKRNPKAPDFKFADSGEGLWLDQAPAWFNGPGEGITLGGDEA